MKTKTKKETSSRAKELDRSKLPPGTPCLLTKVDVCLALGIGERMLAQMRSEGKFPAPDLHLGILPRWRQATFTEWLEHYEGSSTEG